MVVIKLLMESSVKRVLGNGCINGLGRGGRLEQVSKSQVSGTLGAFSVVECLKMAGEVVKMNMRRNNLNFLWCDGLCGNLPRRRP